VGAVGGTLVVLVALSECATERAAMPALKRLVRVALLLSWGLMGLALLTVEFAYRLALRSLEPLPTLNHPAPLPPKVAAALWAAEAGSTPQDIPRLYPWTIHRYFGDNPHSLSFAWGVARQALGTARERGQVRGNLEWHLKGIAVTAWVTRSLSTDEIVATYGQQVWLGGSGRGLADGARRLYDKDLTELSDSELALLVGLIQSPNSYDPYRHPARALDRRNSVLERFVEVGCLPAGALPAAQAAPLGVRGIS
jgi:hypothetical protein